jgi:uncharacterized membrane protein (DUF106 family)
VRYQCVNLICCYIVNIYYLLSRIYQQMIEVDNYNSSPILQPCKLTLQQACFIILIVLYLVNKVYQYLLTDNKKMNADANEGLEQIFSDKST